MKLRCPVILSAVIYASGCAVLGAEDLPATNIVRSIKRAMNYLDGKAHYAGHYKDYVFFCGLSVENAFPEYKPVLEAYKTWIIKSDTAQYNIPYHKACHIMALDLAGQGKQAGELFSQLKPFANGGKWETSYHLGWDLYACIVAGDKELCDSTFDYLSAEIAQYPNKDYKHHYFTAYCLLKVYEKTKDEKYLKRAMPATQQNRTTDGH